jgi:bifunctional non-homologous end joining protein LigD
LASVKSLTKVYMKEDPSVTLKMSKEKREGKVLLDIYRNHKSQTCVAPYSTRGKPGAPVSTPIYWNELPDLKSSKAYDIHSVLKRFSTIGDPWEAFYEHAIQLHDQSEQPAEKLIEYTQKRDFTKTSEPDASSTLKSPKNSM